MKEPDALLALVEDGVRRAKKKGADHAEVFVREGRTVSLSCRGRLGTPSESHSIGIGVRVALGTKVGLAGSSGLHRLDAVIDEALTSARAAQSDARFAGFAAPRASPLGPTPIHPEVERPAAGRLAACAEAAMAALDSPETTFSAFTITSGHSRFAVANDAGVAAWDQGGRETVLLENRVTRGTRDVTAWDAGTATTPIERAVDLGSLGRRATERARAALDARPLERPVDEVILDSGPAAQVFGQLVHAFSGALVTTKQSPIAGKRGDTIASEALTLRDHPHGDGGIQRRRVDHEGVPAEPVTLLERGIVTDLLYDTRSARSAGRESNGHAVRAGGWTGGVGVAAFYPTIDAGRGDLDDLVAGADRAVLIHDSLTGMFTANAATLDFSATVPYAFYVEHGEIVHAIPNTTVGGNVLRLAASIHHIGGRVEERRNGGFAAIHAGGVSCAN